jgi:hypothetical protein
VRLSPALRDFLTVHFCKINKAVLLASPLTHCNIAYAP